MVGSHDWDDEENGRINMSVTPRQVGSSFKPIVYALAFQNKIITPATLLKDQPKTYPPNYRPKNYDNTFRGNVLVRRALANSLNILAVEVMSFVGVEEALSFAKKLGLEHLKESHDYGLSLVLESGEITLLELTNAYATFARSGIHKIPTIISTIEDKFGETVYKTEELQGERVLTEQSTYLLNSILSDRRARAEIFGTSLNTSIPAAVKTGTTEDYRDALTLGYNNTVVVGVWVGNNDNSPMNRIVGSRGAVPIWRELMERFTDQDKVESFEMPAGIKKNFSLFL